MTFNEASALHPGWGGYTDWRLPTQTELVYIYYLYLTRDLIRLDQFSPLPHGEGKFIWTGEELTTYEAIILALNRRIRSSNLDSFHQNVAAGQKENPCGACYVRGGTASASNRSMAETPISGIPEPRYQR